MSEGFLSRWSRRKEAVREGQRVEPEPTAAPAPARAAAAVAAEPTPTAPPAPPPPTLEEAQALTPQDDFSRFVRADVPPDVKNAALKKLFADPHFNEMDGLDIYIDDYGKPDPLPPAMLRQLASARFLKLFDDEEDENKKKEVGREVADKTAPQSVAQSATDHADPDLRLQQDDAPGPEGPGDGAR